MLQHNPGNIEAKTQLRKLEKVTLIFRIALLNLRSCVVYYKQKTQEAAQLKDSVRTFNITATIRYMQGHI